MNDIWISRYELRPLAALNARATRASRVGALLRIGDGFTHTSYQPNAFSERISIDGSRLIPPSGSGIGFDDLLAALPWERLK